MKSPAKSAINHGFAEFAWLVKNWSRPLGLWRLNCPVQLMGTGMIFPWKVIRSAPLASGDLVEDMSLGWIWLSLARPPCFFPFALCQANFPCRTRAADSQRQRWVQGHNRDDLEKRPSLLFCAITRGNLDLLVLWVAYARL